MEKYDISIIVAVYNTAAYLEEAMDSIVNQSIKNKEVIVVDDGSTDNSLDILKRYQDKYSFITIIPKKNEGTFLSRIDGMKRASGHYIAFVDSDDVIKTEMFETMLAVAEDENVDVLECGVDILTENMKGKAKGKQRCHDWSRQMVYGRKESSEKVLMNNRFTLPLWKKIYKRTLAEQVVKEIEQIPDYRKKFRDIRNEDEFLTPLLLLFSDTYYGIPDKMYYWRMNTPTSITLECKKNKNKKIQGDIIRIRAAKLVKETAKKIGWNQNELHYMEKKELCAMIQWHQDIKELYWKEKLKNVMEIRKIYTLGELTAIFARQKNTLFEGKK